MGIRNSKIARWVNSEIANYSFAVYNPGLWFLNVSFHIPQPGIFSVFVKLKGPPASLYSSSLQELIMLPM
jgi:hypothetical protein